MSERHSLSSLKYIDPKTLFTWLISGKSPTNAGRLMIVDVRDSDYIGGHIKSSRHYPSSSLTSSLQELKSRTNDFDDIVFHCMLSQQRGPSAALKFLRSCNEAELQGKNVWLLRGGFAKWQELYGNDERVTEAYIQDIWN